MKRLAFACVLLFAVSQAYAEPVPWSAGNGWTNDGTVFQMPVTNMLPDGGVDCRVQAVVGGWTQFGWTLTHPPVFTDNPALSSAWADMLYMFNYYSDLMQNVQVEYLEQVQVQTDWPIQDTADVKRDYLSRREDRRS